MNTMSTMNAGMKVVRRLNKMHLIVLVAVLIVMGCGASTQPVTYYILNPMEHPSSTVHKNVSGDVALGIGPIHLPAYLDRPQIVTRPGANRLKVDDFHRWAAPLPDEIARIVVENLEQLTGIQRFEIYPWTMQQRPELAVELEIQAFEGQYDGTVILDGVMMLHDWRSAESRRLSRSFHFIADAAPGNYAAMAAALSRTLTELSRQIGEELLVLLSE